MADPNPSLCIARRQRDHTEGEDLPTTRWLDNIREDCTALGFYLPAVKRLPNDRSVGKPVMYNNLGCQRVMSALSSSRHYSKKVVVSQSQLHRIKRDRAGHSGMVRVCQLGTSSTSP